MREIGIGAFISCSSLQSVVLPSGIEKILSTTFRECSSLKTVTFSENLTSIAEFAFFGCSALESITLPEALAEIGTSTFRNCISLKDVAFGNSLESIGICAFEDCAALKSIAIPESVEKIGLYAFRGTSLESAVIQGEGSWQYSDTDSGTPEVSGDIPAEELSDPAAAAKALSQTYAGFYLLRKTASPDV